MSRCTHGYPSTNSRRNHPPAIDPAPRPPEFFTSAMSDLRRSRYSSHSGNGQQRSPARSPASRTSASRASSFPIAPIATWPSATTTAPVSVAVDHRRRLEAPDVRERVAQNQASLGVGVDDLDGLAEMALHDIARFHGVAGGEVFGGGNEPDDIDLRLE